MCFFGFVEIRFSVYGSLLGDPNKILGDGCGKATFIEVGLCKTLDQNNPM